MTKYDLERRVADLEAGIQELRAENARLRAGRTAYWDRWDRKWQMPVERVEDSGMLDRVQDLVSGLVGEGEVLSKQGDSWTDDAHWSAEYRLTYRDDLNHICPMGRWWIIRYSYDSYAGSAVDEVTIDNVKAALDLPGKKWWTVGELAEDCRMRRCRADYPDTGESFWFDLVPRRVQYSLVAMALRHLHADRCLGSDDGREVRVYAAMVRRPDHESRLLTQCQ